MVTNLAANAGDPSSIPEAGKSPGEGNGYLLQYSCLGSQESQTRLSGETTTQSANRLFAVSSVSAASGPKQGVILTLLHHSCLILSALKAWVRLGEAKDGEGGSLQPEAELLRLPSTP